VKRLLLTLAPVAVIAVGALLYLPWGSAPAEAGLAGVHMTVHQSPTCSCCGTYVNILGQQGAEVTVQYAQDLAAVKEELAVPAATWSCHTLEVAGYAVEGHVPLAAIEQLLADGPEVRGIGLPGMPAGSPGMGGTKTAPFTVLAFQAGTIETFGEF